ncbi:MAG: hypothetical protein EP343_18005 [Deltaproteobacteria bacterium]|nr:MAG: hypothetical protein EP343_18005 [Deltaproteobacteria bacterium]
MKNVIRKGWFLISILGFALCCSTSPTAFAAKNAAKKKAKKKTKKGKRTCAPCYRWDKRKRRCLFRCKVGKELCYRGRCIRVKRCSWAHCKRLNLRTNRCVSKCRKGRLCDRGVCRKRCPAKRCYNPKKKRCVKRCPKGKRCIRRVCR